MLFPRLHALPHVSYTIILFLTPEGKRQSALKSGVMEQAVVLQHHTFLIAAQNMTFGRTIN
jgi:hypothetical protein